MAARILILSVLRTLVALVLIGFLSACVTGTRTSGTLFPIERTNEVQVGMTQQDLIDILGAPYVKESYIGGTKLIWSYSTTTKDHTFVVTIVDNLVASRSEYIYYH